MKNTSSEHIVWVDLLRVLACFLVVVAHSCDPFVARFDTNHSEFLTGAFIGSLVRPCVPLFVMISGLLLLPVNMEMREFYRKRARRLLWPFVFWSLMLPVLYFLYVNSGIEIVNPNIVLEDYTIGKTLQKLYLFIFNFNYDTTVLWYAYMLIGLYLFMPVISAWLVQAGKKDIQWFLRIWVVSMFLPYIQMFAPVLGYEGNGGNLGLLGVCEWNPYGMFYYFSGFLGYVVLAYYLKRFPLEWSMSKALRIAMPLFLAGYAITAGGFVLTQEYYPGSYANLEIIWYFSGINVFLMTFAIYIVMQRVKIKASPVLSKIATLTFGIYLCHFIFVQFSYDVIYPNIAVPAVVKLLLVAILSFGISLLVIWLMSLNKYTRKVIM
ncbi:surface polysaccharide O-acyltransferase-like enzyme [Dysgonomonas hofstadii]|uniref:Surface polysaccharide O-acyltransferase-like enzyme n=1 Tax=Dysgonomonas hofstadii TaxID=637886 RepID=A0A840CLB3_9BACT|nr:acyltransferase family protein [Dysgonomonas hofstadii]MBB4035931.1 surface polysaccharide O-acyltransferase-like enzyme [Dysgonomonas hofstadii]